MFNFIKMDVSCTPGGNKSCYDFVSVYDQPMLIEPKEYHEVVSKLRYFFSSKGYYEAHTQNCLSILAACEDPYNICTFNYHKNVWPLPQTGQMWLEYHLLKNPEPEGYFSVGTSFRYEDNPVPGRHDIIFPMFEFEMKGGMDKLIEMEKELLEFLGYPKTDNKYPEMNYEDVCKLYDVKELEHEHETQLYKDYGSSFFLNNFPRYTSPFWNMKRWDNGQGANKVDVILSGMETIGSAERSCNPEEMREEFLTISDGLYSQTIYDKFGKERVDKEMDDFLSFDFFPRSGGGIGLTRLIKSMRKEGLLECRKN